MTTLIMLEDSNLMKFKRLGTGYINLLQIYRYDYETPREETMKVLHGMSVVEYFN